MVKNCHSNDTKTRYCRERSYKIKLQVVLLFFFAAALKTVIYSLIILITYNNHNTEKMDIFLKESIMKNFQMSVSF